MTSSNKKKQEEELNLKTLREIVALAHNKHCFDCNQRGPTYVNMTIGSFVCTACSGLLRGLNPPHRVKSISMASFNNDEMEFIKSRGNELCRKVWLGLLDNRNAQTVDSKDEGKMRDLMCQRYEKRRWYIHPNESLYDEARLQNQPNQKPPVTVNSSRTLSSLVNNLPPLNVQQTSRSESTATSSAFPIKQRPISHETVTPSPQSPSSLRSQPNNILADLGSYDLFSSSTINNGGFADFSAFNSIENTTIKSTAAPMTWNNSVNNTPLSLLQPLTSLSINAPAASNSILTSTAPASSTDKYSALAGLDGLFSQAPGPLTTASIDWDGSGKSNLSNHGSVSWGLGSSIHQYNSNHASHSIQPQHHSVQPQLSAQSMQPPSYASSSQIPPYTGIPSSNPFAGGAIPHQQMQYPPQNAYSMPVYQGGIQYPLYTPNSSQYPPVPVNGGMWQGQMYTQNNGIRSGVPNPFVANQIGTTTGNANLTNPFLQF